MSIKADIFKENFSKILKKSVFSLPKNIFLRRDGS
jgi:hypothetical protein